jgi:hypothetical protein
MDMLLGELDAEPRCLDRVVDDEEDLVADRLDHTPAVLGDQVGHHAFEPLNEVGQVVTGHGAAPGGVTDDVDEAGTRRRRVGVGVVSMLQHHAGRCADKVAAPDVVLHLGAEPQDLTDLFEVAAGDLARLALESGAQHPAHLPLGEAGKRAPDGPDESLFVVALDEPEVDQRLSDLECIDVELGEGDVVVAHLGKAERPPASGVDFWR